MVLGRKTTEVSALLIIYEMYIPFTSFTLLELILIPWLRWSSSGFSTIKLLFFPFDTVLCGRKSLNMAPRNRAVTFHLLEGVYIHKLFGISLQGGFVSSLPLVCLISHLYQYRLTGIYFILYVII